MFKGWLKCVLCSEFLKAENRFSSGHLINEKSVSKPTQIAGRIQFLDVVRLRISATSDFLS